MNHLLQDNKISNENFNILLVMDKLKIKYNFSELSEGSFAKIIGDSIHIVKLIKDIKRFNELIKEQEIYQRIYKNPKSYCYFAKFPLYYSLDFIKENEFFINQELDCDLTNSCYFKTQKILNPISYYGDIYDDESESGFGFVVTEKGNKVLMITNEGNKTSQKILNQEDVYAIDKPGNLIHFYINHFDTNLKEKLDNNQGILLGKSHLEKMFTQEMIHIYSQAIGELISFLIFELLVIPVDVEILLGTDSMTERVVIPYITDFNECDFYKKEENGITDNTLFRIAKSLYNKNGRFYFPNQKNIYYESFAKGFLNSQKNQKNQEEKMKVLTLYNSFFQ